jgi:predicted DsbA family dithiol-disulfide isomerase
MNANDIWLVLPPSPRTVLHWFDFICPFCYLGQQRNQVLSRHGLEIVHLPFQIHRISRPRASRRDRATGP